MAYLAIARRWRPSRFEDLVGQEHVVQTLKNAIRLSRVSHAYLFSGARGVGKTSVARIFAKALRCPNAKDAMPCNECAECLSISESRSVDVVEIDGASNNGVEAVRGIRENVPYGASSGQYKIYIIDEVHMLSLSAFNALLKTLEEPPAHVIFIFATTESQKIPLTILSRCQRFEFRRLTNNQITERLKQILASEKLPLSEEALRTMAGHSDGSLRDALSLLDQVLSYYGDSVGQTEGLSEKKVVEALGVTDSSSVRNFFQHIFTGNTPELLKLIGDTYLGGVDLKAFAERCLEELRLIYLVALSLDNKEKPSADVVDISAAHLSEIEELVKTRSILQIERMAQILGRAITQLGWSSLPRFVLEMAGVRMSKLSDLDKVESGVVEPEVDAPAPHVEQQVASRLTVSPGAAPATGSQGPQPAMRMAPPPPPAPPHSASGPMGAPPPHMSGHMSDPGPLHTVSREEQSWKGFVDSVMKKRPLLGALLSHAAFRMQGEKPKKVILAFASGSFYERQAMDAKNRQEIDNAVKAFFGPEATLEMSAEIENATQSLEDTRKAEVADAKKTALEHPMVLQVKEILGAEVIDVNVDTPN